MFEYDHLWTVRYYDGKGREIRTVWKSHLGIGYETEDRDYAFSGEVTERRLTHVDATGQNMTERYTYSYDDWGRPLTVHHQLGAAPSVSLHSYSYDGLGRLSGDERNGVAGLGTVYSYNVRSWLTESATGVSGGTFRERLSYGESQVDGTPNTPRWGGDVSRVSSCATGDASAHHYRLGYDGQGRLVSAAYGGGPSGSNYSAQFSYDSHGNVLTSSRSRIGGGSGAELGVTELASFQYTGNQLTGRLAELQLEDIPVGPLEPGLEPEPGDSLIRPLGLAPEPSGELLEVVGEEVVEEEIVPVEDMQEVFYDRCGRVVGDPGSGIQSVEYNELSLPSRVTFTGVRASLGSDRYGLQYVASGRKLRTGALVDLEMGIEIEGEGVDPEAHGPSADMQQVVPERAEVFVNERDYVGNLVYQGGVLDKILIDGGYINASDGSYHFFVTDRLGNVRVVANAGGGAEQVNHYDPYGGTLSISSVPDTSGNRYKWGGKEWDKTLYRYDFGARLYDPSDLRWRTMDPLCEKYYSLSPYAYCANNPMNLVDPSGESTFVISLGDGKYQVVGGNLYDNDLSIYMLIHDSSGNYTGRVSIGETTSISSFYNYDRKQGQGDWEYGAIIDLNDESGMMFLSFVVNQNPSLAAYAFNARSGHFYDFKVSNGTKYDGDDNRPPYRGMVVGTHNNGTLVISSARDIGNMAAGFVAGRNGLTWDETRFFFDGYQKIQSHKFNAIESQSSINAEWYGWESGYFYKDYKPISYENPIYYIPYFGDSFMR